MLYQCKNSVMETQKKRVEKLRVLVEKAGGIAAFVRQYNGIDPTYISQLLNGHRSFGERAARNMESKIGVEQGWFDNETSIRTEQKWYLLFHG